VVSGSIDFDGLLLSAGEGIVIPAGTVHGAEVGAEGVSCVEAFEGG
jgi:quercetin dioxygenase-like cupin family protein